MKILVCIKPVPDSDVKITIQNGQPFWGDAPLVINPFDELAIEGALLQKDALDATVTALCIGDESAGDALKPALAMGVDEAILVSDSALANLDTQGTARVLAAAVKKIADVDMLVFGRQSLGHGTGLSPAQTARALGWPLLSLASSIQVVGAKVTVERVIEEGRQTVSAGLPAVISVAQGIGKPRYPSFSGIRRAVRAQIPVWTLADFGISAPAVVVRRVELFTTVRTAACEIISGDNPDEIADKLVDKILAEKVL